MRRVTAAVVAALLAVLLTPAPADAKDISWGGRHADRDISWGG